MLSSEEIIIALEREDLPGIEVMNQLASMGFNPALLTAYDRTTNADTRQAICDLLGRIADPAGLDTLTHALNDDNVAVRASAADAIGKIFGYVESPPVERRAEILRILLDRWRLDDSDAVRSTLLQTLALLGDPVVKPILEAAQSEKDARVRRQAAWGLGYLERVRNQ